MRRLLVLIAIITLAAQAYAGGGGKKKGKVITVWTQASDDHPEGMMFRSRVDRYNKANPDGFQIKLENITRAGAGSGYIDKLNAAINARKVPDIFTLDGPDVAAYADAEVIAPLEGLIDAAFTSGFTPSMMEQGTVNGKLYALGYQDSAVAITYNEALFDLLPDGVKESVPSSDEDWTWEEFYNLAVEFNNLRTNPETMDIPEVADLVTIVDFLLSDVTESAFETPTYFLTPLLWSNGGALIAEDGLTVDGVLNSPENVEALTLFGRFFSNDLALPVEPKKAFHKGQAAMAVAGFWFIPELTSVYPDLKFRTLRYPKFRANFDGSFTPSGSWAFVASSAIDPSSERGKAIVEILEWMTNDEAATEYYIANGAVPGRINALSVIDTNTDNPYHNEAWEVLAFQIRERNKARPVSVGYPYLSQTFARDIILGGIAQKQVDTPEGVKEVLDEAVKKIDQEFKQYK